MAFVKMTGDQYLLFSSDKAWGKECYVEDEEVEIDGVIYCDEELDLLDIPPVEDIKPTAIVKIRGGSVNFNDPERESEAYTPVARRWLTKHLSETTKLRVLIEIDKDGMPALRGIATTLTARKIHFKIL